MANEPNSSSSNKRFPKEIRLSGMKNEPEKIAAVSSLVGRIIEKGFAPATQNPHSLAPPQPTVLPFPVARHRSDGPHWAPLSHEGREEEPANDEADMNLDHQSAFAKPLKRKPKKDLDFSKWRELLPEDLVHKKMNPNYLQTLVGKRKGEDRSSLVSNGSRISNQVEDMEQSHIISSDVLNGASKDTGGGLLITETSNFKAERMDVDVETAPRKTENRWDSCPHENMESDMPSNSRDSTQLVSHDNRISSSLEDIKHSSIDSSHVFSRAPKDIGANKLVLEGRNFKPEEEGPLSSTDIDAENRALLQRMSREEIEEAQAEITKQIKPSLLEKLKERGRKKLEKESGNLPLQNASSSPDALSGGNDLSKISNSSSSAVKCGEDDSLRKPSSADEKKEDKNRYDEMDLKSSTPMVSRPVVGSSSWKSWSDRVEAVRALRFSLHGTVVREYPTQLPTETNSTIANSFLYNIGNVTERDFLRTEGDPGGAGYTIKDAMELTRSTIPGQRALALQLLASVLDQALHGLLVQNDGGREIGRSNYPDELVDWQAVWSYALGPEPQLALSLRMALDDNHVSVVLACARVIQRVLSYEMNEQFFDLTKLLTASVKDMYTAPVFRSRPEFNVGFLKGGYWKYSAKPSNMFPFKDNDVDDGNDEDHTIQDDVTLAAQDVVAGLIRMGILPRLRFLLEVDQIIAADECLLSILVALARHSPTCANAIVKCPRLLETIVNRFIKKSTMDISHADLKSVCLLRVLAQSDRNNCVYLIEHGIFQNALRHLYMHSFSLERWLTTDREQCKMISTMLVGQLSLWEVCINYGYCLTSFSDFFPAMSFWLSPLTLDRIMKADLFVEFSSVTRQAYLVLGALSARLPNFYSVEQAQDQIGDDLGNWSWNHVFPMVDTALKWVSLKTDICISSVLNRHVTSAGFVIQNSYRSSLIWVISAVLRMLSRVFEKIAPQEGVTYIKKNNIHISRLTELVFHVGLLIFENGILNASEVDKAGLAIRGHSFVQTLCSLRNDSDYETSLSSGCCLHELLQTIILVDKIMWSVKAENKKLGSIDGIGKEVVELLDGLTKWSQNELKPVLLMFMEHIASEWYIHDSFEMFGRGGPAPGVGLGWGAPKGGFWSRTAILCQVDARVITCLLQVLPIEVQEIDKLSHQDDEFLVSVAIPLQKLNAVFGICLVLGPRDSLMFESILSCVLLRVPFMKYLGLCVHHFLRKNKGMEYFCWVYKEDDYQKFSEVLNTHFRNRWLSRKTKSLDKAHNAVDNKSNPRQNQTKVGNLDTIYEETVDAPSSSAGNMQYITLQIEWANQRLPLPVHWFLSPLATVDATESIDVARSGLFFLLGLETMSSLCSENPSSPILQVPLVWKLHALSMVFLKRNDILEEKQTRDTFKTLQDIYGQRLDKLRQRRPVVVLENEKSSGVYGREILYFIKEVHESYGSFIEILIEQFSAVSYGDVLFGRQLGVYLHRTVEVPVRLLAWKALSNAHILELLPPINDCIGEIEGYLIPFEDNEEILEAYLKSWVSGDLDRAATRGSLSFTVTLHHLSSFLFFSEVGGEKLFLKKRLAKSLLRDFSRKTQHQGMLLKLIRYEPLMSRDGFGVEDIALDAQEVTRRLEFICEACDGSSSLLAEVDKLKSALL
ncbi:transcriptional elongation regulator MINIYO isoform X2 [Amborella trichopoda]|uniref:RNA polymerase II-associated protein 1 C-terminal domain-containing protein n=1 Tax=Amborella trichopoda TaxID=13333 RepID=W1P0B8_AMBTC|nr:transcriptional elongation regulator MINIYO isoform X2 [Amborella trichopoda]ERN00390.1 hypothetical protein AMTR_s00104p00134460 [Amborella trichopoda]|eukprot:XP_020519409.1 transcriptional elongation regulator MINIYO isoform X2 [Amborella trichopoda]